MGYGVMIVIMIIVAAVAFAYHLKFMREARAAWRAVAAEHGLDVLGDADALDGEVEGVKVHVRTYTTGSGKSRRTWTEVTCTTPGGLEAQIGKDGFFRRLLDLEDLELGDPRFDGALRLRGDRAAALAVFGERERDLVATGVISGWSYDDGTWTLKASGHLSSELAPQVARGLALARVTRFDAALLVERLQARAEGDPSPEVRRQALEALVVRAPNSDATRAALAQALGDPDGWVRLFAAREAGEVDVIAALAPDVDALPVGARKLFVRALATLPVPQREALAVARLADADADVQIAAARALGDVGTIPGAVPALVPLREKMLGGDLKEAARDAILAIQARAGSPGAGGLAVIDAADEGHLALVEDEPA